MTTMAEQSFIFLDGVSHKTEERWWSQGVRTWEQFLSRTDIKGLSPERKLFFDRQLQRAQEYLQRRDYVALASVFPRNQHWRLYDLCEDFLALDIETSGYYGDITVVGVHDGAQAHFLVKNKNLDFEPLQYLFSEPKTLLTFNGSSFDLPVISRRFPQVRSSMTRQIHIDLRHVAAKLGFSGGLKTIEIMHGIAREEDIIGMSGDAAVWLWQQYELEGDEEALRTLLLYNEADVKNLFVLAELLIPRLWAQTTSI